MRQYCKSDFPTVRQWMESRGQVSIREDSLSPVGVICEGLACGFLQFTDNNTFSLEAFATNPNASPFKRAEAMIRIALALVSLAKSSGFTRLVIFTREKSINRFLGYYGFSLEKISMGTKYI